MLLHFIPPRKLFNTESGSVDEARRGSYEEKNMDCP